MKRQLKLDHVDSNGHFLHVNSGGHVSVGLARVPRRLAAGAGTCATTTSVALFNSSIMLHVENLRLPVAESSR
jgi:hypothetical protein